MKNKKHAFVIIFIASLLLGVTFMDTWMVFRQTRMQIKNSGIYQIETISGELETTIGNAKSMTLEIAVSAREYMDDREALEEFIRLKKTELSEGNTGAFNVYIANDEYVFIPDFDMPADYVATERVWYTGAIRNGGSAYVTSPYQDAMTGETCYSVSVMLGDGRTVLAIDYTMENLRSHINQTYKAGSHNALIITDEGIIAGSSDEKLIGEKLLSALPDYAGIWSLSKNVKGVATARIRADFLYDNLFAMESGGGWYLIVSINDWELYRDSYIQLAVTIFLSIALFVIVIILYLLAVKNQKKAENVLASKEAFLSGISDELSEPLQRILDSSVKEGIEGEDEWREEMARIRSSGEKLSEMIKQIISYSSIVRTEKNRNAKGSRAASGGMDRRLQKVIVIFMVLVMLVSLYTNISATYKWGNVYMQKQAEEYEYRLSEWINTQKSILDMFASIISTNPEMLDDYDRTITFLNRITVQYPEISVTYMTNPNRRHTVYMNNGWEPDDPDWHVEERSWYVDLMNSEDNWIISAPYYDEQTGGYCVTFAEKVYDYRTGEFLGNFGIDFFMDKLVDILGGSYSDDGYAFLVDPEGHIINHPYGSYQMSMDHETNVSELPYLEVRNDLSAPKVIRDYDGSLRILVASKNRESNFSVYVTSKLWLIYGRVFAYATVCLIAFLSCIILVYRLLSNMIRWQDETNAKMQAAADEAIAGGKAKSRFLAQMSHEIRTPINAVLGMNEMILRESADDSIRNYAENIRAAGKNLLSIINSILDFSKMEDGKMEIISVKYDVASLVNNLVNSIGERAHSKGLELITEIDEKIPTVLMGDDIRISQVIMNLLTNAVKYTEKGKVILSIKELDRDNGNVTLEVKVSDTGIGIRKEDMGKLFESFERLEEKRNRNIEGTGLGMSIVTGLLEMMGSKLNVESVYGKGSVFSFCIDQRIINPHPMGRYTDRVSGKVTDGSNERHIFAPKASILVVDDNETNLLVIKNLLKLNGILPDTASSGEEAVKKMKECFYHIVFLDHMMPVMDGIETLERIKEENLAGNDTVMIALTANAASGSKEFYIGAGFDDYLSKPIEVDKLEEKIFRYLPKGFAIWQERDTDKKPERKEVSTVTGADENKTVTDDTGEILEFEPVTDGYPGDDAAGMDEGLREKLADIGLDADTGIDYCGGDIALYKELIGLFAKEYSGKAESMKKSLEREDYREYRIVIHALKGTLRTIGAGELSEQAMKLEAAANASDGEYIRLNHSRFMDKYEEITEKIKGI
ncbi:MAG: response regulator [Lachnospiraceae bacterium]|nr:response regulator [Lachnospiraceae bacterium]